MDGVLSIGEKVLALYRRIEAEEASKAIKEEAIQTALLTLDLGRQWSEGGRDAAKNCLISNYDKVALNQVTDSAGNVVSNSLSAPKEIAQLIANALFTWCVIAGNDYGNFETLIISGRSAKKATTGVAGSQVTIEQLILEENSPALPFVMAHEYGHHELLHSAIRDFNTFVTNSAAGTIGYAGYGAGTALGYKLAKGGTGNSVIGIMGAAGGALLTGYATYSIVRCVEYRKFVGHEIEADEYAVTRLSQLGYSGELIRKSAQNLFGDARNELSECDFGGVRQVRISFPLKSINPHPAVEERLCRVELQLKGISRDDRKKLCTPMKS